LKSVTYQVIDCEFDTNYYNPENNSLSVGLDINVAYSTRVEVTGCSFSNNFMDHSFSSGTLYIKSGNVFVDGCYFAHNTIWSGPVTILNTDETNDYLAVTVKNSRFERNSGVYSASIYSRLIRKSLDFQFSNLSIVNNTAIIGILFLSEGPQVLSDSVITNNGGIGIFVSSEKDVCSSKTVIIRDTKVQFNSDPIKKMGLGLSCDNINLNLIRNTISNNSGEISNSTQIELDNCNCPPSSNRNLIIILAVVLSAGFVIALGIALYAYIRYWRQSLYTQIQAH